MKKLICAAVLIFMVLMMGCKDEIMSPLEQNIQYRLTMDKRSQELFKEGCDVIRAADTLISEYTPEDTPLLQSLFSAGYDSAGIVKVIHIVLDYDPRPALSTLLLVLDGETEAQIAGLILKEYVSELNLSWSELKYFISLLPEITEKISVLKDIYGRAPEDIVKMLHELNEDISIIFQKIQEQFPLTEEEVQALLLRLKCSAYEITAVLGDQYSYSAEDVIDFLTANGYQVIEILIAVQKYYNLTIVQIYELIGRFNFELEEIINILKNLNFDSGEIIQLLVADYEYHLMFKALIANNYELIEVLKELKEFYALNIIQITELIENNYNYDIHNILLKLKEMGYSFSEIGVLLKEYYNLESQEISQYLMDIGADAKVIVNFLTDYYNMLVEDIAPILNNLHFSLPDMVLALWDHIKFQVQRLCNIFTSLGYEICDILKIIGLDC